MRIITRITTVLMMFALLFTAVPGEAHAVSKPPKVKINYFEVDDDQVDMSWLRISGVSGYVVYKDGKAVQRYSKNAKDLYYDEMGLSTGRYEYTVRAYKKIKQYYDSKSKKWVNKKPKKSRWKGKKTRKKTIYGKPSAAKTATIKIETETTSNTSAKKTATQPTTTQGSTQPSEVEVYDDGYNVGDTISFESYNGEIVFKKVDCVYSKYGATWELIQSGKNRISGGSSYTTPNGEVVYYYRLARIQEYMSDPRYNREIDGTFKDGSATLTQKNGVVVNLEPDVTKTTFGAVLGTWGEDDCRLGVEVWSGDANKISIQIQNPTTEVNTKRYDQSPIVKTYVMGKSYRLAQVFEGKVTGLDGHTKTVEMTNVGLESGVINAKVYYDFNSNGEYEPDEFLGDKSYTITQAPERLEALSIAQAAVDANGGSKSYDEDMDAIDNYVYTNYNYNDRACGFLMRCNTGAYILETWSIYKYGVYGFKSYGSYGNPYTNPDHIAFHPDPNPYSGRSYYETQGHK